MNKLGKVASAVKAVLTALSEAEKAAKGGTVRLTLTILSTLVEREVWWVRKASYVAKTNGLCHWNKDGVVLTAEGRAFLQGKLDDGSWGSLKGAELLKSEVAAREPKAAKVKAVKEPKAPSAIVVGVEARITALEESQTAILTALTALTTAVSKLSEPKARKGKVVVATV